MAKSAFHLPNAMPERTVLADMDEEEDLLMEEESVGGDYDDNNDPANSEDGPQDLSHEEAFDYSSNGRNNTKAGGSAQSPTDWTDQEREKTSDNQHFDQGPSDSTADQAENNPRYLSNNRTVHSSKASRKAGDIIQCDICNKTFSNWANMRRHRQRHSGIKPYSCQFCDKKFYRRDHMREHISHKHHAEQPETFSCYFCYRTFTHEKQLFQHVTSDHRVNSRELHCQFCSFSATTIGSFLFHMSKDHAQERPAPDGGDDSRRSQDTSPPESPNQRSNLTQRGSARSKSRNIPVSMASMTSDGDRENAEAISTRDFGDSDKSQGTGRRGSGARNSSAVRYVSILPKDLPLNGGKNADMFGLPDELSLPAPKSSGEFPRGNYSPAHNVSDLSLKAGSSSNRRKSSAPVRVKSSIPSHSITKEQRPRSPDDFHQNNSYEDLSCLGAEHLKKDLSEVTAAIRRLEAQANGCRKAEDAIRPSPSSQSSDRKCPHCLIIYPDSVLYLTHKMLHTNDHPFRCSKCRQVFPNRYEFYAHIVNHDMPSGRMSSR